MEKISTSRPILYLIDRKILSDHWSDKIEKNLSIRLWEIVKFSLRDYLNVDFEDKEKCINERLGSCSVIEDFENKYPVIKQLIERIKDIEANNITLMMLRITENLESIYSNFSLSKENNIVEVIPSLGDYHGNKLVAELHFGNGKKLIYKTRNGFGEKLLESILGELGDCGSGIFIPVTLNYTEFMVQEYVQFDAYLDEEETKKYYLKFGIMAAIFTWLGTSDLHGENIIATKKGPVFVDLETLLAPHLNDFYYNNSSILSTFLFLGRRPSNVYAGLDISGFSGKGNSDSSFKNIPRNKNNMHVNPYKYSECVIKGFQLAKSAILEKKKILINKIKETSIGKQRKVIRNTGFYQQFIFTSLMPKYTKSFSDRQALFDLLSKHSKYNARIIEFEKEALSKLEIPYFEIGEEGSDDEIFEFVLGNNFKEGVIIRLQSIDDKFFEYEQNILRQLLTLKQPLYHLNDISKLNMQCNRIEHECRKFLDYTLKNGKLTYITKDSSISEYIIDRTNDIYIFGGALITAILYFNNYDRSIFNKKIVLNTLRNNGHFTNVASGISGVHSQLLLLKTIQKLCNIGELKQDFIDILNKLPAADREIYDFSGVGSSIIVCSLLLKDQYDELLCHHLKELYSEYFLKINERKQNTGLFHGYSGDILTMISILDICTDEEKKYYLVQLEEFLSRENKLFSKQIGNWIDTRNESCTNPHDMVAISYGAAGILLTRLFLNRFIKNSKFGNNDKILSTVHNDILLASNKILSMKREDFYDDTFINGYAGAVLSLYFLRQENVGLPQTLQYQIDLYLKEARDSLEVTEWRIQGAKDIYFPNFMNGNMGITFVLMMLDNTIKKRI